MKVYLRLVIFFCLWSCTENTTNSECEYEDYLVVMTVKDIIDHPEREGLKKVIVSFNTSSLALEDQDLGELRDMEITEEFLERKHVHVGNKYRGVVSDLVKGDCQERFFTLEHNFE